MSKLIDFHHDIMFFLVLITIAVLWLLLRGICNFRTEATKNHISRIELTHEGTLEML
jgi:heme/copper-type cytochrome/quinol oxidase subunit 2